jgi:hypothetical protein
MGKESRMNRHERRKEEALARLARGAGPRAKVAARALDIRQEERAQAENAARFRTWMEANKTVVDAACQAVVEERLVATHACVVREEENGDLVAKAKLLAELAEETLEQGVAWISEAIRRARVAGHLFLVLQPKGLPPFMMARELLQDPRLPPGALADPMRSTALDEPPNAKSET